MILQSPGRAGLHSALQKDGIPPAMSEYVLPYTLRPHVSIAMGLHSALTERGV
jgi:hypothetical protein